MVTNPIGIVTASVLNVRPEPSTRRPPVGQLRRGERVTINEHQGRWYGVRNGSLIGFVHGDYLMLHDENAVSGFLFEQADLRQIPLEPVSPTQAAGRSAQQRAAARTWNRFGGLLHPLSTRIGIDPGAALAVLLTESGGEGFGPDGRLIIRFENHLFYRYWGRENEALFRSHFQFNRQRRWTGHTFRAQADQPRRSFHGSQEREWEVFSFARRLSEPAALLSISMGAPQIVGFNHARIGYDATREMFDNFSADIRFHILGLFDFILGPGMGTVSPMLQALQREQFEQFAALYNGPGNAVVYGARIQQAFDSFRAIR